MGTPLGSPLTRERAVDLYFMEHRAKLIDIAAFLDRVERSGEGADDFRMSAFRDALRILSDGEPERARRVLELFSDPTEEPIERAPGKGAAGAWPERQPGGGR